MSGEAWFYALGVTIMVLLALRLGFQAGWRASKDHSIKTLLDAGLDILDDNGEAK